MQNHDILRAALVGHGRMGREIEERASASGLEIVARFDSAHPLGTEPAIDFDVAIEFTTPAAVIDNLRVLLRWNKAVVIGTTGWHDRIDEVREHIERHHGRVVYGSNFSIGVLMFTKIVREAARMFNGIDAYDVAVHEIHHRAKTDAPSGTALVVAGAVLDELDRKSALRTDTSHGRIDPGALHVTSQRLGSTVGTHQVAFDSDVDTIELTHRAKNRGGFALGALLAARWIAGQPPGLYRFEDVF
ncbi:MAG: 4-hydroxy-tetrahydrodipicolinate reductase [bacterium]|nr:4-hydroxy-tetrahydrodipicolinate reductase [Candidatus Kapabacteria bacterium]